MCWAYQEIQKESLPSTATQCWFSHTQTIDRFIASVVTKMLCIVLEGPILPIAPHSSFTVNYTFPKTFPNTWSNAFMQNSWHTILFDEFSDSQCILVKYMSQFQRQCIEIYVSALVSVQAITFDQILHDLKFGLIKVLQCIEDSFFLCLSEIFRGGGLE